MLVLNKLVVVSTFASLLFVSVYTITNKQCKKGF